MNTTGKLEIYALAAALALGILGDGLLRNYPWGLNFGLWGCLLGVAIYSFGRARGQTFARGGWWLLLPIGLAPLAFMWHDSLALDALNLLALVTAFSLVVLRARGVRLHLASMMQYAICGLLSGFNATLGMFPLLLEGREWTRSAQGGPVRKTVAAMFGLVLAFPPLMVFGGLFMGADAVFRSLAAQFLWAVPRHATLIVFLTVIVGGYLRGLITDKGLNLNAPAHRFPVSLGAVEMAVMLGLLDLLFLAFVAVQVRYFLGGSALVKATTGLTYSEYARQGFFQLLAVAALLLPFLLLCHWLLRAGDSASQRWFRWLAGVQIVLLFVIMASAFERMHLYQAEYGMSEQRLYPTAFMGWLAVVFVWFALTVLRGQRQRFGFGAMVAGFLLIAVLHLLNPDALIARTNLARVRDGHTFDAHYAATLSGDAVPELVAGLPDLNPKDRCTLARGLIERWPAADSTDWRSWNLVRARAWRAVSENQAALHAACGKPAKD